MTGLARWGWIGGWGVAPAALRDVACAAWPDYTHEVFPPSPVALPQLHAGDYDMLVGYSLGALILLAEPAPRPQTARLAIAPILAFDAEAGLGGRTPGRTREAMTARFERSPSATLKIFSRLVALNDLDGPDLPYDHAALRWGLHALGTLRADVGQAADTTLFLGTDDPLTTPASAAALAPHLNLLPGLNHDFRQVLPAVARQWPDNSPSPGHACI